MSDKKLSELAKGLIPPDTNRSTHWALRTYDSWKTARNRLHPQDQVPEDLLTSTDPSILNIQLSRFAVEARKENGDLYPPATIHQLLCGLLRHMREINHECPKFLDKTNGRFRQLQCTLDSHFSKLHSQGVGRKTKHAEPFTKEEENVMWKNGVLG